MIYVGNFRTARSYRKMNKQRNTIRASENEDGIRFQIPVSLQ